MKDYGKLRRKEQPEVKNAKEVWGEVKGHVCLGGRDGGGGVVVVVTLRMEGREATDSSKQSHETNDPFSVSNEGPVASCGLEESPKSFNP